MKGGWVYIMTNRPDGTLYVGVTNDIVRRTYEHRTGFHRWLHQTLQPPPAGPLRMARRYPHSYPTREEHQGMAACLEDASDHAHNPEWRDLYPDLF